MREVPDTWLFEPWRMPTHLHPVSIEGKSTFIATPVVDLALATRESKSKLHALRKTHAVRAGNEAVVDKHASRKPLRRSTQGKSAKLVSEQQLGFNF